MDYSSSLDPNAGAQLGMVPGSVNLDSFISSDMLNKLKTDFSIDENTIRKVV